MYHYPRNHGKTPPGNEAFLEVGKLPPINVEDAVFILESIGTNIPYKKSKPAETTIVDDTVSESLGSKKDVEMDSQVSSMKESPSKEPEDLIPQTPTPAHSPISTPRRKSNVDTPKSRSNHSRSKSPAKVSASSDVFVTPSK